VPYDAYAPEPMVFETMRKGRLVGRGATCDYSTHGRVSYGHVFARMDGLLRNDSRRLTPGGAPMLSVCMYAARTSRSIQEVLMSFIRSSVQELCCLPMLSNVS